MAFDEALAERIRRGLARKKGIEEKKMFGGITVDYRFSRLVPLGRVAKVPCFPAFSG